MNPIIDAWRPEKDSHHAATTDRSLKTMLLLTANGGLLAITLMLSRLAQLRGLSPVAVYSAIAGLISLAAPQLLIFIAVGQIGAGFVSIVYAFPVLLTFVMARALSAS